MIYRIDELFRTLSLGVTVIIIFTTSKEMINMKAKKTQWRKMDHRDPVINGNKKFIIIHDDISVPYILIGFYHNKRRKGRKLKSVIYDRLYVSLHFNGMRYLRINFRTSHSS